MRSGYLNAEFDSVDHQIPMQKAALPCNRHFRTRIAVAIQGLPTSQAEVLKSALFDSFDHEQLNQGYMAGGALRNYIASWLLADKSILFGYDEDSIDKLKKRGLVTDK